MLERAARSRLYPGVCGISAPISHAEIGGHVSVPFVLTHKDLWHNADMSFSAVLHGNGTVSARSLWVICNER